MTHRGSRIGIRRLLLLFAALLLLMVAPSGPEARAAAPDLRISHEPRHAEAGQLTSSYFVGVWETRNIEFGRDVTIFWTVRGDASLDYDFVVDGIEGRGSTGTWDVRDGILTERWRRPDGSTGEGRAAVERIDDNTLRLTIIDNGKADYTGLVRVYRRRAPPQTVEAAVPR